ncbi:MAG: acetylxylan esterase [Chitinophagaceae bacterium]
MNIYFLKTRKTTYLIILFLTSIYLLSTSAINTGNSISFKKDIRTERLPHVFNENQGDLVERKLRQEAVLQFPLHRLPVNIKEWNAYKINLKKKIIEKTGALLNQKLPLNFKETGGLKMKGYTIKNVTFQTRPGIYATANLYIPIGEGKFPGVMVMMGHSATGRLYDKYQSVGITLALNGYVSLCIDPWGSGERTTIHGVFEDHGDDNNLGSSFMDVGETLMGMLITDNMRGVDLLCSLPYVDTQNIGATGSSGGGNQTMWLTAMDDRIKAAVPVVSAGTFEAYIMGSPCICEVLVDGLTFTEEAGVLALVAPRAIKMCNHSKDANQAFNPREMVRSYKTARPIFEMLGAANKIAYDTFDLTHGYWPEDRATMLGWFNLHLKATGTGMPVKEIPFETQANEPLMVYAKGKRDPAVVGTEEFCKRRGNELRLVLMNTKTFDREVKRKNLRTILRVNENPVVKKVHAYDPISGWDRFALETSDNKLIPVLLHPPTGSSNEFIIVCDPAGKQNISTDLIKELIKSGTGIAVIDLYGTGETSSAALHSHDDTGRLRTLTKSYLWLGKTVMGEWEKELNITAQFIHSKYKSAKLSIHGIKEAGIAGLYLAVLGSNIESVTLQDAPISYLFDNRSSIEFFSTGIHVPGFLNWGDVSLVAALSGKNITFINPVTMSGGKLSADKLEDYKKEFEQMRKITGEGGEIFFR